MGFMNGMNISASGMTAQSVRMDTISQNIANASTTRDADGNVYRRQTVLFAERDGSAFQNMLSYRSKNGTKGYTATGVKVTGIVEDHVTPLSKVYDPSHPDADEDGYVTYPNVNTVTEMTNLIDASRSYEANVTAFNATKNMLLKGIEVGK